MLSGPACELSFDGQKRRADHKNVWNLLKNIGFQKKVYVWMQHELTQKKSFGPNKRLRSTAETERIRPIFEADGDR